MGDRTNDRKRLLAAMFVDTLGGGLLVPFELIYALRIAHLSLPSAGFILSLAAAAGIAVGPTAGALVDRLGAPRVVAAANVVGLAGCASLAVWTTAWGYALGAFLLSANMRIFWAAFAPLVASIAPPSELELWFGRLRAARYIGIVAGEASSGLVFLAGIGRGLRILVEANGLSFVLALALVVSVASPRTESSSERTEEKPNGGYRDVFADPVNAALAGLNIPATILLTTPILILPIFVLDHLHLPPWLPGVLAALLTVTAAGGLLFGSALVRGRRRLRNLEIAAALWALGCLIFLLSLLGVGMAYGALFGGVLLLGLGEAMYAPTADALPTALAPPGLRGRYAALHQMAWGISEAVAPTLGAAALAAGNAVLWLTLAGIAVATAVGYHMLEGPARGRDGVAGESFDRAEEGRLP